MKARGRTVVAIASAGTAVALAAVLSFVLRDRPFVVLLDLWVPFNATTAIVMFWMAFLILRSAPRHVAGWLLLGSAAAGCAHAVVAALTDAALVAAGVTGRMGEVGQSLVPADLPLSASIPIWFLSWVWIVGAVPVLAVLPLVFPDGRPPRGRRRIPLVVVAVAGVVEVVAQMASSWPTATWSESDAPVVIGVLVAAGGAGILAAAIAGLVDVAIRWRRSPGARRPFEVLGGAFAVAAVLYIATYPWPEIWTPLTHVTVVTLVVVYALAVLRYRLHGVEPVLGTGVLVGLRRLADPRLRDRGTVLSTLAEQAALGGQPTVLEDVAEVLRRSTGARLVTVALDDGRIATSGAAEPDAPAVSTVPIEHRGERLGHVRLTAHAAVDLAPRAVELTTDVARLLGIVLHDEHLAAELAAQLSELDASRRRLVEAQDAARRGLERDIHDGAQARLIAVRLRIAALRAGVEDAELTARLDVVGAELDEAVRMLRELARGVRPPVLEQAGLAAAVRAHVRELPIRVDVVDRSVPRAPMPIEAAAYFAALEAVQNAVRHSGATRIRVEVDGAPGELRVRVGDDGRGFEPARRTEGTGLTGIRDRVAALGGSVAVDSAAGAGTTVDIILPVPAA